MEVSPNLSTIHAKRVTIMPTQHRSACLIMLQYKKERIAAVHNEDDDDQEEDEKEGKAGDPG